MTYRFCLALVTTLVMFGVALADPPAYPVAMERPLPVAMPAPGLAAPAPTPDPHAVWFSADYLLSYVYGTRIQPLVTSNPPDTPRSVAGIFGNPSTVSMFSGRLNAYERSGVRVQGGFWLDDEQQCGVEFGGSVLESQSTLFSAYNDGNAILARPYQNALIIAENLRVIEESRRNPFAQGEQRSPQEALLITYPGSTSGGIDIRVSSGNFYDAYLDLSDCFYDTGWFRLDALLGYRFYRYDEAVRIRQISTTLDDPNLVRGTEIFIGDDFSTSNEFHGAEVGLRGLFRYERFQLELLTKLAAGNLHRRVNIYGGQRITVPGAPPEIREGGFLALSSNIGRYSFNDISTLPELGLTLRYQLTENIRARLGYNILFLNSISRANEQIDSIINPNLFPGSGLPDTGPQQPKPTELRDNLWIMNIGFGLEVLF